MQRILIYVLRRDLRVADNPILHQVSRLNSQSQKPFTHFLPVYILPANQIEISGLIPVGEGKKSPYKEARSSVARFWRCGKLRAQFTAESVWDLKSDLEQLSSGLVIRAGTVKDVVQSILKGYRESKTAEVHGLWMTSEEGWEEKVEEGQVKKLLDQENVKL
jgi:deoxyribodipyrimidine photo-lyase